MTEQIQHKDITYQIQSVYILRPVLNSGNARLFNGITVERCIQRSGPDLWAVRSGTGVCLGMDGNWIFEEMPSNRDDEYIRQYRWRTMEGAVDAAITASKAVLP